MQLTTKEKIKKTVVSVVLIVVLSLSCLVIYENKALTVNEITLQNKSIPKNFSGYRIAQISDLHNAEFGEDNIKLINALKDIKADIIVITGDLIDSRRTDTDIAVSFVKQALELAPVYYVTGNHEARTAEYVNLKQSLKNMGAVVLENEEIKLEKDGEYVSLIGMNDPSFTEGYYLNSVLLNKADTDYYKILLSHRPELFEVYVQSGVNLVFSGHAHGGQLRLPFIGGLYAPHQGFFPEYDGGVYTEGKTSMVVSRGIGNSLFPLRINNKPEIIVVELEH